MSAAGIRAGQTGERPGKIRSPLSSARLMVRSLQSRIPRQTGRVATASQSSKFRINNQYVHIL